MSLCLPRPLPSLVIVLPREHHRSGVCRVTLITCLLTVWGYLVYLTWEVSALVSLDNEKVGQLLEDPNFLGGVSAFAHPCSVSDLK